MEKTNEEKFNKLNWEFHQEIYAIEVLRSLEQESIANDVPTELIERKLLVLLARASLASRKAIVLLSDDLNKFAFSTDHAQLQEVRTAINVLTQRHKAAINKNEPIEGIRASLLRMLSQEVDMNNSLIEDLMQWNARYS